MLVPAHWLPAIAATDFQTVEWGRARYGTSGSIYYVKARIPLNRAPACEMNARLAKLASFSGWWSSRPSAHVAGVMPFPSFVRPQICSCVFVSAIIASRATGKKAHKTETHPIANAGALHGRDV